MYDKKNSKNFMSQTITPKTPSPLAWRTLWMAPEQVNLRTSRWPTFLWAFIVLIF